MRDLYSNVQTINTFLPQRLYGSEVQIHLMYFMFSVNLKKRRKRQVTQREQITLAECLHAVGTLKGTQQGSVCSRKSVHEDLECFVMLLIIRTANTSYWAYIRLHSVSVLETCIFQYRAFKEIPSLVTMAVKCCYQVVH